jgi:hypothetical protein
LPLFTGQPRETVRKVSETLPAEPNGPPGSGFSVHFALRIAAKSSLGLLLVPFSDSLRRRVLGNSGTLGYEAGQGSNEHLVRPTHER